jgi:glycosyltransferase involved in cell wall biosynthesis
VGRLGRGGAELQLMRLSEEMARRGHHVELLTYDGASPFDEALRAASVSVRTASASGRTQKVRATAAWFAEFRPNVVHAVMKRASSLALLARLPRSHPAIIATDMSTATYGRRSPILWGSLVLFGLADRVVTQTELNRANLERLAPWLRGKTEVVRNGLDVDRFVPASPPREDSEEFRFCVVATVSAVKNPERVVRAVAELRRRGARGFQVDWYGRLSTGEPTDAAALHPAVRLARELAVDDAMCFHGDTDHIEASYQRADALLHASLQEGFPNAVAEGMACGLPVIVSRVSDLPLVVEMAQNGFVFDERDVASIADAMARMLATPPAERRAMGQRSREIALAWFALDRFASDFENLYRRIARVPSR